MYFKSIICKDTKFFTAASLLMLSSQNTEPQMKNLSRRDLKFSGKSPYLSLRQIRIPEKVNKYTENSTKTRKMNDSAYFI